MIEDRIVFDGEEILCIYHKGIDDFVTVNHEERTTLDGKLLEFIEQKVDSDIVLGIYTGGVIYWRGFESLWP